MSSQSERSPRGGPLFAPKDAMIRNPGILLGIREANQEVALLLPAQDLDLGRASISADGVANAPRKQAP